MRSVLALLVLALILPTVAAGHSPACGSASTVVQLSATQWLVVDAPSVQHPNGFAAVYTESNGVAGLQRHDARCTTSGFASFDVPTAFGHAGAAPGTGSDALAFVAALMDEADAFANAAIATVLATAEALAQGVLRLLAEVLSSLPRP